MGNVESRRHLMLELGIILAFTASAAIRADAQTAVRCGSPGGAVVTGTVVNDSTQKPVAGSWVVLLLPMCRSVADENGRFRFEDVQPGTQRVDAGQRGYREFAAIVSSADAGDTLRVELRLKPGGPIEDCRVNTRCAPLLQETPVPLNEDERLRLAGYGSVIAIAWTIVAVEPLFHVCLDEPSAAVTAEFARRYSRIAKNDDCQMRPNERGTNYLRHIPTGERAVRISLDRTQDLSNGQKRVSLTYIYGSRAGESWDCDLQLLSWGWKPVLCVGVLEY